MKCSKLAVTTFKNPKLKTSSLNVLIEIIGPDIQNWAPPVKSRTSICHKIHRVQVGQDAGSTLPLSTCYIDFVENALKI